MLHLPIKTQSPLKRYIHLIFQMTLVDILKFYYYLNFFHSKIRLGKLCFVNSMYH